jgi:adenylylsulfate kinase
VTGAIVWFTGLPASGKTTLARRVQARLSPPPLLLDSDELRDGFDIRGYEAADRDRFYAQLASLAMLVARQGFVVLVAATAPSRAHRDRARASELPFVEVWVRTPLHDCERRDRKGLYAAARRGDAPALPGIGVLYEPPVHPEVVAEGGHDDAAVAAILARVGHR